MTIGTISNGESGSSVRTKLNAAIGEINALGTAADADTGDFATAVQGSKADTAMQPLIYDPRGLAADVFNLSNLTGAIDGGVFT